MKWLNKSSVQKVVQAGFLFMLIIMTCNRSKEPVQAGSALKKDTVLTRIDNEATINTESSDFYRPFEVFVPGIAAIIQLGY